MLFSVTVERTALLEVFGRAPGLQDGRRENHCGNTNAEQKNRGDDRWKLVRRLPEGSDGF